MRHVRGLFDGLGQRIAQRSGVLHAVFWRERHPILDLQHVARKRLTMVVGEVLTTNLKGTRANDAVTSRLIVDAVRAIWLRQHALTKGRPGSDRLTVELQHLVARAQSRFVEVAVFG